jgi:hypothetical protein
VLGGLVFVTAVLWMNASAGGQAASHLPGLCLMHSICCMRYLD